MGSEISKPLSEIVQNGPFAAGVVLGCLVSYGFSFLASKERSKRQEIDLEREKELLNQNKIKDERIDQLHQELRKQLEEK